MIKYGSDHITELVFRDMSARIELRDGGQWVDIEIRFALDPGTPAPEDLIDLTALVICTAGGAIAQIVPQDEGIDCEYQFTASEKEQLRQFVESGPIQAAIAEAAACR